MAGKRRGHNEGTITQRADGRWEARVSLGYEGGKLRRKCFYGKTRKEVQEALTKALRDVQQGIGINTQRQTVAQFLTRWLEETVKPSVRPRTYESYKQIADKHLLPTIGRIQLDKLTAQHVQGLLNAKRQAGLSATTVRYIRRVLRIALGRAVKWGLIPRNAAALADAPTPEHYEISPLTPEQARTFLVAIEGDRLEALYTVAVALGLRKGEAMGLRWQDVDLEDGALTVRMQLQRIDGKKQLTEPKTERSRRTVALPPFAVAALRKHKFSQLEERLWAGSKWQEWGLVFTTPKGTPLESANLTHAFHAALERAGLPRQRFHDLRHTCASLLLAQGVEPRVIMDLLGHSQITMTLDLYSHIYPETRREAAERMEEIFTVSKPKARYVE